MKFRMLILVGLLALSCQDIEKVERPENLIPESKMVEVLTDLSLMISARNFNRRMLEETGFKPGEFLYQKHNIDSLSLAESTKFYAKDPANLERIYLKVQQNLDSLKTDLEVIREEEKRIQDSINSLVPEGDSLRTRRDSLVKGNNLVPVAKAIDTLKPLPEMRRNRNRP